MTYTNYRAAADTLRSARGVARNGARPEAHAARAAYRALYARYGLRLRLTHARPKHSWDGVSGVVRIEDQRMYADMLSHELAHYLVATPRERRMPEFGLGNAPCAHSDCAITSRRRGDVVEGRASLLGIWIAKHVEGPETAAQYLGWHNWEGVALLLETRVLRERGLLV